MRAMLVILALVIGCGDNLKDPAVQQCEDDAAEGCERIGYGSNETCLLALAQRCSVEDTIAAHEACCAANGLPLESECRLVWR